MFLRTQTIVSSNSHDNPAKSVLTSTLEATQKHNKNQYSLQNELKTQPNTIDQNDDVVDTLTSRKRSTNYANLSPSIIKRKYPSEIVRVLVEGKLNIQEINSNSSRPRTIRSIACRVVAKNNALYLESVAIATSNFCKSSNDDDRNISALTLSMYLDDYILEYKEWEKENKFKLVKESHSYICEAPSREEYKLWLQALDSSKPIEQEHHEYVISSRMIGKSSSLCNSFLYSMPPKTMHIILVRHGHYINAHARHIQDAEQILTQLGRQQANVTGKYLEQLYSRSPTREEITIYHSDMSRAVETASIMSKVFGHCSLSKTSLLREGYPGRPFSIENHRQVIGPAIDTKELERMELAYQTFFSQNEEEPDDRFRVVVCHANLIRFFLCRAMKIDPVGMWGHFEINHCGVTRINICENRPIKVISVNETGHLPHTLITSSEDHL